MPSVKTTVSGMPAAGAPIPVMLLCTRILVDTRRGSMETMVLWDTRYSSELFARIALITPATLLLLITGLLIPKVVQAEDPKAGNVPSTSTVISPSTPCCGVADADSATIASCYVNVGQKK